MMGVCVCGGSRGGFSVNLLPDDFMISYVWFFFFFFFFRFTSFFFDDFVIYEICVL